MKRIIKIKGPSKNERIKKFRFNLPHFTTYYEDDEIIIDSFVRMIKYKIENEFCRNESKIVNLKIKNKKDLIVEIYYEATEKNKISSMGG